MYMLGWFFTFVWFLIGYLFLLEAEKNGPFSSKVQSILIIFAILWPLLLAFALLEFFVNKLVCYWKKS